MAQKIDLDAVAVALELRRSTWTAAELTAGPLTWRNADTPWPQRIVTDRAAVNRPESLGITLRGPDDLEADIVLGTGGWADIDGLRNGSLFVGNDPQFDDVQSCLRVVDDRSLASIVKHSKDSNPRF